jgi:hypothetical protein
MVVILISSDLNMVVFLSLLVGFSYVLYLISVMALGNMFVELVTSILEKYKEVIRDRP